MTDKTIEFLLELHDTRGAVMPMIAAHSTGALTEQQIAAHVAACRQATGDEITNHIAVYLACAMLGAVGLLPDPRRSHGFAIQTIDGRPVDVDDAPPGAVARARMVSAIANGDPMAAHDVFVAYRNTQDDEEITNFLTRFVVEVSDEAKRRGMVMTWDY